MQRQPSHTKTMRRRDTLTDTRLAIHDQVLLQAHLVAGEQGDRIGTSPAV